MPATRRTTFSCNIVYTRLQLCGRVSRLIRPIRRPLAIALHHVDEFPCDDTISLLTGVQLIVPHEAVGAGIHSAVEVRVTCDIQRRSTVKISSRVVVDVGQLWQYC
jgi:hypothetical protein